jgi:oxaloacetate decarboxylase (Na+ extruding) subunit alpha
MSEIHVIDTTLRDGQLSLWALGMRTGAMLAIADQMDQCGFQSMEFFGFAGYMKFVREHKENPCDWIGLEIATRQEAIGNSNRQWSNWSGSFAGRW